MVVDLFHKYPKLITIRIQLPLTAIIKIKTVRVITNIHKALLGLIFTVKLPLKLNLGSMFL